MKMYVTRKFESLANWISDYLGTPSAFFLACLSILIWAAAGPFYNYSDSWMLWVNTGTTIATFLMMFLLQHTGNRTIAEMHDRLQNLEKQNALMLEILQGEAHYVAGMRINYDPLTLEEIEAHDEHAEALIARSKIIYESPGL